MVYTKKSIEIPNGLNSYNNSRALNMVIYIFAVLIALFHIWVNSLGVISDLWRNSLHLGLLGALGFLLYPLSKKTNNKWLITIDILLAIVILSTSIYLILFEDALHTRNEVVIIYDLIFASIAIIMVLEINRRTSGLVIPILIILVLTYVLWWGNYLEGIFHFRGAKLSRILYRMYFTDEGLFGLTASISSTFVFMFILFAAFLLKSGGGDFIVSIAKALTKNITGGPGLVAVVASGLMGTISGSAIANTVSTGSITIPMMKKAGFEPKFSAGIETASSVGGQLMPPVMGAGAFIMAQWTGLPYITIIGVAFLPAVMYFSSVAFFVYQEAKLKGIKTIDTEEKIDIWSILREGIHFFIPIILLVVMLIIGFTPTYSAGFSIIAIILSSYLSKNHKMKIKDILDSLALGSKNMIMTGVLLVGVGIIIGSIAMTGISIVFSQAILDLSDGILVLTIIFITIASLLLGMGLPVTAAYIMLAVLAAPALTIMGVSLLAAHMIIFWISQDSNVTPPVSLAAFAAAGIAGSKPMLTGFTAWKLAKGLYIIPFLFAYTQLIDGGLYDKLTIFIFGIIGLYVYASIMTGYLFKRIYALERIILAILLLFFFWPSLWVKITATTLLLILIFISKKFEPFIKRLTERIQIPLTILLLLLIGIGIAIGIAINKMSNLLITKKTQEKT